MPLATRALWRSVLEPPVIHLSDYRIPDYLVSTVEMTIELHPTETHVTTTTAYFPNKNRKAGIVPLRLDGDELSLHAIDMDGKTLPPEAYSVSPESLVLHAPPQKPFTLTIQTIINPTANKKLMGLYRSNGVYCTQCEADGFRRISYFQDRPDVMATYRVRLEAEEADAPILLANGNPVKSGKIKGTNRHFALWEDPHPKPCYLFAVVGGDLSSIKAPYTTSEGRKVKLGIYVEKGKEKLAGYAMGALERSMRWDETAFGRAYDLDVFNIVAVSDFNMGAMENKGLNIFNDKYILASPETATDMDYLLIEAIIAHEYFHNWTGNRITCRDWFQLCLKEGLTVYRDQEFTSDIRSRPVKRIMDARELRARQFPEDMGPLSHPVRPTAYSEINNFYTATVYEKGAEIIRMLKLLIGDKAFRKGMDLYFKRHDGDAATMEQFLACFAETAKRDLTHFSQWYHQAGTPEVAVERKHHPKTGVLSLRFSQKTAPTPGQATKAPQVIPIALGFVDPSAKTRTSKNHGKSQVIIFDKVQKIIEFPDAPKNAVPSVLRGFSAPINLHMDLSDEELLSLASLDPDPFNRWESLQSLSSRLLQKSVSRIRAGEAALTHDGLSEAFRRNLQEAPKDPAFGALCLSLPSEQDIAREIGKDIDPDAIHTARKALRQAIGQAIQIDALATYKTLQSTSAYEPDAASSGRRSLRNAMLDLVLTSDPNAHGPLAYQQFRSANNMTDRFAALSLLTLSGAKERDDALERFEQQFVANPLVMDKWFALQASVGEEGTLARVKQLMQHKAFSLSNPNRARSLIGGFAMSNPTQFNRKDGKGYQFVAETALEIDTINPQVSARIVTAFRSWRNLESKRRTAAEAALTMMLQTSRISRDLRDIVDRTLR
jgi:aminopeptidase N